MIALTLSLIFSAAAVRAESDSAFTDYEKIVDHAFSASVMERYYSRPTEGEREILEGLRSGVLELIEGAGGNWLTPLTYPAKSTNIHRIQVREVVKKTPIWVCRENCSHCSGNSKLGCAVSKQLGESVANVLVFHSCLFQGKNACAANLFDGSRRKPTAGIVIETMKVGLTTAAYTKFHGVPEGAEPRMHIANSVKTLHVSSRIISSMTQACPGPFSQSGYVFLHDSGHIKPLNSFVEACGQKLFDPIQKSTLPTSCKQIIDPLIWNKVLVGEILRYDLPVIRCDGFCEWVTCGDRKSKTPRLMQFGSRWFLSVPADACSGSLPADQKAFTETVFQRFSKPRILETLEGRESLKACMSQLSWSASEAQPAQKIGGQPVELPDGPNIELNEPSN